MMNREELLNGYVEYLSNLGKSKETIRAYKSGFNRFFNNVEIKSIEELDSLNSEFFLDYANSLRDEVSVATINKLLKQLTAFWNYLVFKGYVRMNVLKNVPSLNNNTSEYREKVMSNEQVKAMIKASEMLNLRDKTIIYLMLNIAPRIGEVSRIRLEDLAFDEGNKIYIRGKGGNDCITRWSNVNDKVKDLINELIKRNRGGEYLFENYMGERLEEQSIRKIWYQCCELADVKGFSPHSVRHYVGSTLVKNGVEIKKVSFVLGHKSSATTEKYYVKPKESMSDILDVVNIF